ncbi:MAG: hypothetical protein KDA83_16035, partial [Planctomycetales bacterium]|nr:hypothetical protein [Planctomycetales bacterium]
MNQKSGARAEKRSRVTLGLGIVLAAALTLLPTLASAQAPTQQNDNVEVVGRWSFSAEQLSSGEVKGDVLRDLDGPRPPEFPDLDEHNLCWKFLGNGGRLEVQDGQSEGSFKFSNGDTIVIEAWVNLTGLPDGSHAYVIGKGRTHTGSFPHDNQNWALRLTGRGGEACLSFLFATAPGA